VVRREDTDCFAVDLKQGQRLSVEVEGIRLGRTVFDSLVTILDPDGKVLSVADGSSLVVQDAITSVIAPKAGSYTIQLRESSYGGNEQCVYRMHVGSFPRPLAVYPAGGRAGEQLSVKFIGDPAGEFVQQLKLPAMPTESFGIFAEKENLIAPSANVLRVSDFPNVLEVEPNNDREHATAAADEPPVAFNGILSRPGDADWFRFKAKKGQTYDVNVFARRIRSPLDSVLEIFDAKGSRLAQNDDSAGLDSYLKFNVPADGDYFVKVSDQLAKGGPNYTYRVEVDQVPPSLSLNIPDVARNDTQSRKSIVVPRGNRFATLIAVKRSNASGDLALKPDGLPAGIQMQADTLLGKLDRIPVVFEAAPDAPIAGNLFNVIATHTDPEKKISGGISQAFELVLVNNVGTYHQYVANRLAAAVVEEVPFKLSIVEPKAPLVQYGVMDLKVVVDRRPGFDQPIDVKMLWNPPGISSQPDMTIPKGENSVLYRLNASGGADIRQWKMAVIGSAKIGNGTAWVSSQLANVTVAEPFLELKLDMAKTEQGQPVKVVAKLDQKIPFEGRATVKLLGLPSGCSAPDLTITKEDKEIAFNVTTDAKTPAGTHKTLFCSVTVMKDSEPIAHSLGSGGILRVDAPKLKVADAKTAVTSARQTEKKARSETGKK